MEGPVGLVARAPADRVGKFGDRARIGARQPGDDRVDQRARPPPIPARGEPAPREPIRWRAWPRRRARRARLRSTADRGRSPPRTISSSLRGSSRKRRQRERIVGRTWPGRCDTMRISERCGGSSTIFSKALALLRFRSSAESTMATRQPPKAADKLEHLQSGPHVLDGDLGREPLRVGLPLAPDEGKIGMGELGEQPRRRMARIDMQIARLAHRLRGRVRVGEHEAGERAMRASPCRSPPCRRSARRGRGAPRDRPRAFPLRRACVRPANRHGADGARR